MGGKHRQAKAIAAYLQSVSGTGFRYCEPFCGSVSSAVRVITECAPREVRLYDVNRPLILLWQRLLAGTLRLPLRVTDADYQRFSRLRDPGDPLTAWFGIALSFRGKWFGGLARRAPGRRASYDFSSQVTTTLRKVDVLRAARRLRIAVCDYWAAVGQLRGFTIYLDPPYADRTKAHDFSSFDTPLFWERTRQLSRHNTVCATCFDCPADFRAVHEWGDTISGYHAALHREDTNERLVVWKRRPS